MGHNCAGGENNPAAHTVIKAEEPSCIDPLSVCGRVFVCTFVYMYVCEIVHIGVGTAVLIHSAVRAYMFDGIIQVYCINGFHKA